MLKLPLLSLANRSLPSLLMVWVFGFFALFSFDLFVEAHVFEWLEWNGTNKNDWFFILWWGVVFVWAIYGITQLAQHIHRRK